MVFRPDVDDNLCFVIMPFDDRASIPDFATVLRPALDAVGLTALRADHSQAPETIMAGIWRHLWRTRLALAVLTGNNPNVAYELGICHTLGIPTILVAEGRGADREQQVPVDYRSHKIVWYEGTDADSSARLRRDIATAVTQTLGARATIGTPLPWPYDSGADLGCERVFENLSAVTPDVWRERAAGASRIAIAKLRLHVQEERYWSEIFADVLKRGGTVEIAVADPTSPAMLLRYWDERIADSGADLTAWKNGLDQLIELLEGLLDWSRSLVAGGIATEGRLQIRLCPHYPTQAMYLLQSPTRSSLFLFSYPFGVRGFHAPVFLFADPRRQAFRFFADCREKAWLASRPLTREIMAEMVAVRGSGAMRDEVVLRTAAITAQVGAEHVFRHKPPQANAKIKQGTTDQLP